MRKATPFDQSKHHIYVAARLMDWHGTTHVFRAIVDTGAPMTEFSDEFLVSVGLLKSADMRSAEVSEHEQTSKYAKMTLPGIDCLGQTMENATVRVSRFAEGWGVDALIGLDFFRMFRVTIDYKAGQIVTETY